MPVWVQHSIVRILFFAKPWIAAMLWQSPISSEDLLDVIFSQR